MLTWKHFYLSTAFSDSLGTSNNGLLLCKKSLYPEKKKKREILQCWNLSHMGPLQSTPPPPANLVSIETRLGKKTDGEGQKRVRTRGTGIERWAASGRRGVRASALTGTRMDGGGSALTNRRWCSDLLHTTALRGYVVTGCCQDTAGDGPGVKGRLTAGKCWQELPKPCMRIDKLSRQIASRRRIR